jgi:hypothetical protein
MTDTANDFINSDGSYDVSAIMAAAHRKARAEVARNVCSLAGVKVRPVGSMGSWNAQCIAAACGVRVVLPASQSYRAELKAALAHYWWRAQAMRASGYRRPVAEAVAPVAFLLAA